jgi:putative RecB family exonuclease
MNKKHLSFTQLNMFLRCPRQYEFRYMDGLKIPPSGAMVQSRVWHETIEKNYRQKISSEADLPLSDMQEFFAARFDEAFGSEEVVFEEDANPARLKDQGVSIVATHHNIIAPKVRPALVEEKFLVSLGEEFPYELMGVWDLVEADGTIVDNKAYSRTPSQDDIDKDLQFTLYSLGYRASRKQVEKGIRMDAVIKNKQPKAVQLRTSRTNEDCRWLLGLIEKVVQAIGSGTFYPNPSGWHCSPKFCGYWDKCKQ